ncbi:hypothetical protein LCGC14_0422940 [marine sediment metagenome]|uniref:DNA-directed DNA polymerase family A palm domain-containing protein n=1 Tax=marine sediment metagenome TaxID=412755 RepID=A0A0F9VCF4_9ZZZZ
MILGIIDLAQIEARILSWIAGQDDLLKGFADGEDIYSEFATTLFGVPVRKARKTDPKEIGKILTIRRGFGKDAILGRGYGMGDQKFFDRCLSNADLKPHFDSGEYNFVFIQKLGKLYHKKYPKISKFWTNIEKAFRWVVKYPNQITTYTLNHQWLSKKKEPCSELAKKLMVDHFIFRFWNDNGMVNIQLPSTRCLKYPQARIVKDRRGGKLKYKKYYLWGGSITENVVQAIARDIFVEGVLRLDAADVSVILRSHDEVVVLLQEKNAEKSLEKAIDIFCVKPSWAKSLPIAGEGELTPYYKK